MQKLALRSSFLMSVSLFLTWLVTCPSVTEANPVPYQINYTLLSSSTVTGPTLPGAPFPTTFTYDPNTNLFSGFNVIWPANFFNLLFSFLGNNLIGYNLNNMPSPQNVLSDFLAGGSFALGTTTMGLDSWVDFSGIGFSGNRFDYGFTNISAGNDAGDSISGTFTTSGPAVPEPSSFLLLGVALCAVAVAMKLPSLRPCRSTAVQSQRAPQPSNRPSSQRE